MSALERKPEVTASTADEDLGPAETAEEYRGAPHDSLGDWTSLTPEEQVAEVPVVTREEPGCNWRKTRRFSPQSKLRAFSSVVSQEKSDLPS